MSNDRIEELQEKIDIGQSYLQLLLKAEGASIMTRAVQSSPVRIVEMVTAVAIQKES